MDLAHHRRSLAELLAALLALALPGLRAQDAAHPPQEPRIRLAAHTEPAEAAPTRVPDWKLSFAAAEAAAKERHVLLLLWFTAKW
jgi:hypothetical protein